MGESDADATDADPHPSDHPDHRLFAALYDAVMWFVERRQLPPHREYLAADLDGDVLDLGAGTGAMFPYLAEHADGATIHAVEPDRHMRRRAVDRATREGIDVDLRDASAAALPFADDSMDVVIASMVFCTIPDVDAALSEVGRALRPGGELRFLEHVRADGVRGRAQDGIEPLWRRLAGGCHPNRDTVRTIADHPAFELVDVDKLDVAAFPTKPFVRGTAVRRDDR